MSETKKEYKAPRTLQEIGGEYRQLCMTAGDLQFKIDSFKRDLALLNDQMRDLNFEAIAANQRDQEAAKKKAEEDEAAKKKAEEEKASEKPVSDNVVPIEKKEG